MIRCLAYTLQNHFQVPSKISHVEPLPTAATGYSQATSLNKLRESLEYGYILGPPR